MKFLISLTCIQLVITAVLCVRPLDILKQEWEEFKQIYRKAYDEVEDHFRLKVFMENKHKISKHNVDYAKGLVSYKLAMNEYGDLLHHEFVETRNGLLRNRNGQKKNGTLFLSPSNVVLPKSVDWREQGYVTEVKNQGQCGSCWSFSTTGSLEGQHFRKTGVLVSLSEQNLIDCSTKYGNSGCNGGLMDQAFEYIENNHGIDTEKAYPYKGMDGRCHFNRTTIGATATGFVDIPSGNEHKLQIAVGTVGPVSVAIDASHESFQFYSTGVYDEASCSSEELDHGVLVVGYGENEEDEKKYWIVKNSWGTTWGEKGYIKMARNKHNLCGIATQASYPLV